MKKNALFFIGWLLLSLVSPVSAGVFPDFMDGSDDTCLSVSEWYRIKSHPGFLNDIPSLNAMADNPVKGIFAVSVQPLGFLQFGPVAGIDFAIHRQIAFHTQVRFTSLGFLSKRARTDDDLDHNNDESGEVDDLRGIAFGFGPLFYFGENRSKFYMGPVFEMGTTRAVYNFNDWYDFDPTPYSVTIEGTSLIWSNNIGFRSLYPSGLFINTGIYLGMHFNWYTEKNSYNQDYDDNDFSVYPYIMLELALGFAF